MALVSLTQALFVPNPIHQPHATTSSRLDADGEKAANIFNITTAGTVIGVRFMTGTVTSGDTVKVSMQGVGADGNPDGTILATATGNKAYGTVVISTGASGWHTVSFVESVTVTQGQAVSIVVEFNSYVSGDFYLSGSSFGFYSSHYHVYSSFYSSSAWAKSSAYLYSLSLEYTGSVFNLVVPHFGCGTTSVNLSTSTTPDEVGNYFQIPYPCRAIGAYVWMEMDYDITLSLLNASNTTLANCSLLAKQRVGGSTSMQYGFFDSDPAASVTLAKETWYRIIATPSSGSANVYRVNYVNVAAQMGGFELGTNCYMTSRTNGGAWTNEDTKRTIIGIIIDQLDNGVSTGGGGLLTHPGMQGGING